MSFNPAADSFIFADNIIDLGSLAVDPNNPHADVRPTETPGPDDRVDHGLLLPAVQGGGLLLPAVQTPVEELSY